MKLRKLLLSLGALFLLVACRSVTPVPTNRPTTTQTESDQTPGASTQESPASDDNTLYVAIIWHQHQPVYYKDPETGIYEKPWVRVHGTKDYLDMAKTVAEYPNVHMTFNITPSLIRQIDDFNNGARDLYWIKSEIPASELTDDDKRFILQHFFDANEKIIARFPRYKELADKRVGSGEDQITAALQSYTEQDFRDLQVLFNLAWMDPDWLAEDPLKPLIEKGRDFSEDDKKIIFQKTADILNQILYYHKQLQDGGQIEVTMTPYAHPILPLLTSTDLAKVAMPQATLPPKFAYPQDAQGQLQRAVAVYGEHFGRAPRGMWPAEGSVGQVIVDMVAGQGIQWMASDEEVLGHSLPAFDGFTRDSADTVHQADELYQPYTVEGNNGSVVMIFRDHVISDKVSFEYSGTPGDEAAADLMQRLDNIQAELKREGASGPHLVTMLLDGENAWENYPNDGKDFLHALYQDLSDSDHIRAVTPSEYLAALGEPPKKLPNILWPGSWISHDFSTWIGEEEENTAWDYLRQTREALQEAMDSGRLGDAQKEQALDTMYLAEGSDWFWWYGSDQNSGDDSAFDKQFRSYLAQVYDEIGVQQADFVNVPIIAQTAQEPDVPASGIVEVTVDGKASPREWDAGGKYHMNDPLPSDLYYGFDAKTLYLRVDAVSIKNQTLGFYIKSAGGGASNGRSRISKSLLGFGANHLVEVATVNGQPVGTIYTADESGGWTETGTVEVGASHGITLELAVPIDQLAAKVNPGDQFLMRALAESEGSADALIIPQNGPAALALPDLSIANLFIDATDPTGDDYGPRTYTYPTDAVFQSGNFDLTMLQAGYDDDNVIFRIGIEGPVDNPWNSPNGLAVQTIDVYIDVDGPQTGDRLLLPGRNAALTTEAGWDYAIWAEGWTPGVYQPSPNGPVKVDTDLKIVTNSANHQVTLIVPRSLLPGEPEDWHIAVVLLGQEGFPAAGVWRVRDVNPQNAQWRFGGAPDDTNHTRIIDVFLSEGSTLTQEDLLGGYESSKKDVDKLTPDDFPQVGVIGAK